MKKILFLIDEYVPTYDLLLEEAKKESVVLDIIEYGEVNIFTSQQQTIVSVKEKNILEYDLVYFRTVGKYVEQQILIAHYCVQNGIDVYDPIFRSPFAWVKGKAMEYLIFSEHKLPVIKSFFSSRETFLSIEEKIQYPCIVKKSDASKGDGVFRCNTREEVFDLFDKYHMHLLFQEYVENSGDIRVLVIGNEVVASIERRAGTPEEFRNNISRGGTAHDHTPSSEEVAIAVQATHSLQYSIAGVDLVYDAQAKLWKIFEVNKAPQFEIHTPFTDRNIPRDVIRYFKQTKKQ